MTRVKSSECIDAGVWGLKLFAQCIAAWGFRRNEMCAAVPASLRVLAQVPWPWRVGLRSLSLCLSVPVPVCIAAAAARRPPPSPNGEAATPAEQCGGACLSVSLARSRCCRRHAVATHRARSAGRCCRRVDVRLSLCVCVRARGAWVSGASRARHTLPLLSSPLTRLQLGSKLARPGFNQPIMLSANR